MLEVKLCVHARVYQYKKYCTFMRQPNSWLIDEYTDNVLTKRLLSRSRQHPRETRAARRFG